MKDSVKFGLVVLLSVLAIFIGIILMAIELIGAGVFIAIVTISLIVLLIPILLFKERKIVLSESSISVKAPFMALDIPLSSIDSIHTINPFFPIVRVFGYSGLHIRCGDFIHKNIGNVMCAFDDRVPLLIMITSGKKRVAINMKTLEETESLLKGLVESTGLTVTDYETSLSEEDKRANKRMMRIIIAAISVTVIICAILAVALMFVGSVDVTLTDSEIEIDATLMNESIAYADITSVELRDDIGYGSRIVGMANMKIKTGSFENNEFDRYRLAVYNDTSKAIVVHTSDQTYVFNLSTSESTEELYTEILSKLP